MFPELLNPTTDLWLFAHEDDMEPTEIWEIVDVKDTVTVFEITALVDGGREVKVMIALIEGVWQIDVDERFSTIHFMPAEEETVGLKIDF